MWIQVAEFDAPWFHWIKDEDSSQVETLQFTQQSVVSTCAVAVSSCRDLETTRRNLRFFFREQVGEIMLMTSSLAKILLTKCTV